MRSMPRTASVIFLILCALPVSAQFPFNQVKTDTGMLAPVVVTATRDSVTQAAPTASTTVISGASLRAQGIVTVQQALSSISSITTVQAGSFGASTSLFMRGGQSNYTLVLVDGAPVNDPGGFIDLANLTTDNIDRIEIVRGPGSVLYGSDAISGVIQIFTRRGTTGAFGSASFAGGDFGSRAYDLVFGVGRPTASFTFDGARYNTNGIYAFNNGYSNDVYSIAGHLGQAGSAHLDVTGRQMTSDYHFPTDFTGVAVDSNQQTFGRFRVGSLDAGFYMGSRVEFRMLGTYTENKSTSENLPDNAGDTLGFYYVDPTTLTQKGADGRLVVHLNAATAIAVGAAYEDQQEKAGDSSFGPGFTDTSTTKHSRNNIAYYANATGDAGKTFSYNAGIRYTKSDLFGDFTTYRVGAGIALSSKTSVHGSIGTAFREPSFFEQFATGFALGNPNLKPETSSSWDAGMSIALAKGAGAIGFTYFSQRFTDMIQYDPSVPPGTPNYENLAEATASGIEAELRTPLSASFLFEAGYTWLKTNVVDAGVVTDPTSTLVTGQALLRRPSNAGNLSLTYHMPKKLAITGQIVYVGSRADIDYTLSERVTLPSYMLLNASMLLTLKSDDEGRFLAVTFRTTNLLNTGYEQTVGFAAPGRAYLVGMKIGVEK